MQFINNKINLAFKINILNNKVQKKRNIKQIHTLCSAKEKLKQVKHAYEKVVFIINIAQLITLKYKIVNSEYLYFIPVIKYKCNFILIYYNFNNYRNIY